MFFNISAVDFHGYERIIAAACIETDVFEQIFHNGVQSARADVFAGQIDFFGNLRDRLNRVGRKLQIDIIHCEQNCILLGKRMLRIRQNVDKILFREARKFHRNGGSVPATRGSDPRPAQRGTRPPQ